MLPDASEPDADGVLVLLLPIEPGFDALLSVLDAPELPVLPVLLPVPELLPVPMLLPEPELLPVLAPLPVLD
jgi:hypothetical protein